MSGDAPLSGPDLAAGVALTDVPAGGMLAGHAGGKPVLLVRRGDAVFAVGGACPHYGTSLASGLLAEGIIRCPSHHACFDVETGEALRAPALHPLPCYGVERRGERVVVTGERSVSPARAPRRSPESVLIVGAGAAGDAAAEMLRREGYEGPMALIGDDTDAPYDRPNISKDYLTGNAPEEWMPLRPTSFYAEHGIELLTGRRVAALDAAARRITLDDGTQRVYEALVIATGASPVTLPAEVDAGGHVRYLRTLADSRAIIARAGTASSVVVLGASFIGLEVAASLRSRGLAVHVVAPEARPLERILGPELAEAIRRVHEDRGVVFHLGRTASRVAADGVTLDDGARLGADLVVAGIGVRPNDALARGAGLAVDRGIVVDGCLETAATGVYAAGDVARYPDPITGRRVRVEHWAVAQRQGQLAARNVLGARERFASAPFFWSQHFDMTIAYVGHAESWDAITIDGSVESRDCSVRYMTAGRVTAVATVGRDRASLEAEVAIEREIARGAR